MFFLPDVYFAAARFPEGGLKGLMTNLPGEKTQTRTGLERQKRQPGGSGKVGLCNTVERVHLLLFAWLFRTQKSETAKWQKMIFFENSTILTLDVEVLRVALSVSLHVGRDAVVQPCPGARHALQHKGVVPHQDPAGHVLVHKLALRKDANAIYTIQVFLINEKTPVVTKYQGYAKTLWVNFLPLPSKRIVPMRICALKGFLFLRSFLFSLPCIPFFWTPCGLLQPRMERASELRDQFPSPLSPFLLLASACLPHVLEYLGRRLACQNSLGKGAKREKEKRGRRPCVLLGSAAAVHNAWPLHTLQADICSLDMRECRSENIERSPLPRRPSGPGDREHKVRPSCPKSNQKRSEKISQTKGKIICHFGHKDNIGSAIQLRGQIAANSVCIVGL